MVGRAVSCLARHSCRHRHVPPCFATARRDVYIYIHTRLTRRTKAQWCYAHPRRRRAEINPIHPNFDAPPPHSRLRPLVNCSRPYPARKDTAGRQSECLGCGGCEDSSESGTKHGAIETCEIHFFSCPRAQALCIFFNAGITARAKMTSNFTSRFLTHGT